MVIDDVSLDPLLSFCLVTPIYKIANARLQLRLRHCARVNLQTLQHYSFPSTTTFAQPESDSDLSTMPAQETALASSADDEVQTTPLQNQEDEDAEIFDLRAEGDVLKRSGGPRILKLSKLNTKNIAYIAKNHELADIIVTLVYHVSGPRRVEELTRNPNFANSKNYESGCNFTTSQIRGSASTKENMAFELYRGGNEVMVWLFDEATRPLLSLPTGPLDHVQVSTKGHLIRAQRM